MPLMLKLRCSLLGSHAVSATVVASLVCRLSVCFSRQISKTIYLVIYLIISWYGHTRLGELMQP